MNGWSILALIIVPLILCGAVIETVRRRRTKGARVVGSVLLAIPLTIFVFCLWLLAPYAWASHLEVHWRRAKPRTRSELESHLALYSLREIQPTQSDWGRNHQLTPGEQMFQHLLLWSAPLDVVYTSNGVIAAIYTSYE